MALFDFTAENSGELLFTAGEVIETRQWVNEEWLSGRIGSREGIFPLGFVKVTVELPKPSSTQNDIQKGETVLELCVLVSACVRVCVCGCAFTCVLLSLAIFRFV